MDKILVLIHTVEGGALPSAALETLAAAQSLGGEVVIDYVKILGGMFPKEPLVVAGYSNAVMAYIPSKRILDEGGYEGGDSMVWYGLPTKWAADVEERVKDAAAEVMRRVK